LPNGVLGITVEGAGKVAVLDVKYQPDGLYIGEIVWLLPEEAQPIPERCAGLVVLLQDLLRHPMVSSLDMDIDFDNATDVGARLTELLPIDSHHKQSLLAMTDPVERLDHLMELLKVLEEA
jgi:uncharacterized protein